MSGYRTLNDRRGLDPSLQNLRFNRTLKDAGIGPTKIDDGLPGPLLACTMLVAVAFAGALLLWLFLVIALGWTA